MTAPCSFSHATTFFFCANTALRSGVAWKRSWQLMLAPGLVSEAGMAQRNCIMPGAGLGQDCRDSYGYGTAISRVRVRIRVRVRTTVNVTVTVGAKVNAGVRVTVRVGVTVTETPGSGSWSRSRSQARSG